MKKKISTPVVYGIIAVMFGIINLRDTGYLRGAFGLAAGIMGLAAGLAAEREKSQEVKHG